MEQVADVPVRVLLTLGVAGDADGLGTLPPNVHVEGWWPQRDVLPHAAVVVGHGGFGTTQAARAAGLPQVMLPLFSFDHFLNAERVASVGNGVTLVDGPPAERRARDILPHGPAATDRLGAAVLVALEQADHGQRARALAAEIDALPDTDACVRRSTPCAAEQVCLTASRGPGASRESSGRLRRAGRRFTCDVQTGSAR